MTKIRTVGQLKKYLLSSKLSPEALGLQVNISNMTIRRLLKRPANFPIPSKYQAQLDFSTQGPVTDFNILLDQLAVDGKNYKDTAKLKTDVKNKLLIPALGASLKNAALELLDCLKNPKSPTASKAICIGALLYLVNPFDLIPDTIPIVGYLDDFAVLTLAISRIRTLR